MADSGREVDEREFEEGFTLKSQSGALVTATGYGGGGGGGGGKVREKRHRSRPGPYSRPPSSTLRLTNGIPGGSGGGGGVGGVGGGRVGGGGGGGGTVRELASKNWLGGWTLPSLSLKRVVGWAWHGNAKKEEEQIEEGNGGKGQGLIEGPSHGNGDSRGGFISQVSYDAGGTSDMETKGIGREKNDTNCLDTQGNDAKDLQNVNLCAVASGEQALNSKQLAAIKKLVNSLNTAKESEENHVMNSEAGGSLKDIVYHTPNRLIADREREIIPHGTRRTGLFSPREAGFGEEEEVFHTPPAISSPQIEESARHVCKTPEALVNEFMRLHPRPGSPPAVPKLTMERWKAPIPCTSVNASSRETWETTSVRRQAMESLAAPLFMDFSHDRHRRSSALVSRDSRFDAHASLPPSRTFQRVDGIQRGRALSSWQEPRLTSWQEPSLGKKRQFHATEEAWTSVAPIQKARRTLTGRLPMTANRPSLAGHTGGDQTGSSRKTEHRDVSSTFQQNLGAPTPTSTPSSMKAQQILASLDRTFRPGETAVNSRLASTVLPAEILETRFTRNSTRTSDLPPPPLESQLDVPVKESSSISLPPSTPTQKQAASQAMDKARGGNGTSSSIGNFAAIGKGKEPEKFSGALPDGWKGEAPVMEIKTPRFKQGQSSLTTEGGEAGQSSGGKSGFRMSVDDEDVEGNSGRASDAGVKDSPSQPLVTSHTEAKKSIPQPTSSFTFGPSADREVPEEMTKDSITSGFSFQGAHKTEVPQTLKISRKGSDSVTSDSREKSSVAHPVFQFGTSENGEKKVNLNFGASIAAQEPVTGEEPKFSFQSTNGTASLSTKPVTEQPLALSFPPLKNPSESSSAPLQAPLGGGQPLDLPEEKYKSGSFGNNGNLSDKAGVTVGESKASGFGVHGSSQVSGDKVGSTTPTSPPVGSPFMFGKSSESPTGNVFGKVNSPGGGNGFNMFGGNNAKTEQPPANTAKSSPTSTPTSTPFTFPQPSSEFTKSSTLLFGGTSSPVQTSPSPSPSTFAPNSTQFQISEAFNNGVSGPTQFMDNRTQAATTPTSPLPVSGQLFGSVSTSPPPSSAPSAFPFGTSSVKSDAGGLTSLSTPAPAPTRTPTPTPTPTFTPTPTSTPTPNPISSPSPSPVPSFGQSPKTGTPFQIANTFGASKGSGSEQTSSSLPSPSVPVFGTTSPAFGSGLFGQFSSSTMTFGSSPSSSSFSGFGGASTSSPSSTSALVFGTSTISGSSSPIFGSSQASPSPASLPTFGTSTISAVSGSSPSPFPSPSHPFSFTSQSSKAPSQFVFGMSSPSPSPAPSPSPSPSLVPPPSSGSMFGTSLTSTSPPAFGFPPSQNSIFGQTAMTFGQGGGSPNAMEDSMGVEPFSPPKVAPQNSNTMFGSSPSPLPGASGGAFTFGQQRPPQSSVGPFGVTGPSQMPSFGQPQTSQPFGAPSPLSPLPPSLSPSPAPAPSLAFGPGAPVFNMGGGGGEKAGSSSRRIVKAKRNRK